MKDSRQIGHFGLSGYRRSASVKPKLNGSIPGLAGTQINKNNKLVFIWLVENEPLWLYRAQKL